MKRQLFAAVGLLAMACAMADETQNAIPFSPESSLSTLLARIPGGPVAVPWLPKVTVVRYDESLFDKDKTIPAVRDLYEQWCKARLGRILQPRDGNCTFLRNGLGCAVGELQQPGLGTDFERGLKDAAAGSGDVAQVLWPTASWLISENVLFNIFANKGANQISIVGGLQRCMADRTRLVGAMAFVSINGNNDLLFLDEREFGMISRRGIELSRLAAEKKKDEIAQKKAEDAAKVAVLAPGEYVLHIQKGQRGMIIEMKPPLAQIQWDRGYGSKSVEWNRLDELRPEKRP